MVVVRLTPDGQAADQQSSHEGLYGDPLDCLDDDEVAQFADYRLLHAGETDAST